jgi:tetratricopeptide (TPR) repeat protein
MQIGDVFVAVEHLLALGKPDAARQTLEIVVRQAPDLHYHEELLELLPHIPQSLSTADPAWVVLIGRMRCNARDAEGLLMLTETLPDSFDARASGHLLALRGWALLQSGRSNEALEAAMSSLERLPFVEAGLAWRVRGEALATLGEAGWQEAFDEARSRLSGRSRGTCLIEYGNQLERHGDVRQARAVWSEALALLDGDMYYQAWLHHALGISCLRIASPEAEHHFLEMERLSRHRRAAGFRARAWCGLGAIRRALGEFERAESSYRAALAVATEAEDELQAHRGLGHTLRLSGRPTLALAALEQAVRCLPNGQGAWVHADLAATHLVLKNPKAARRALERCGTLFGEDAERAAIVRAELARRDGDANTAVTELKRVRFDRLWAREERGCFPELFDLAASMGLGMPEVLPYPSKTMVEVRALGILQVRVNGREVPIKPTGRPGELLVLLLERNGEETVERLLEALYPGLHPWQRRRKGQALWGVVRKLRFALGWEGSVRALGGAYRLDEQVEWHYDVMVARRQGVAARSFLEGIYSEWARTTARTLLQDGNRELN